MKFFRIVSIVLLIVSSVAQADTDPPWEFKVTPYLWMIGMDGVTGPKGFEAEIDMNFGDIFANLDSAFIVTLEAKKGRWTGWIDFTSMTLATDAVAERVNVKVQLDQKVVDAAIAYQLEANPAIEVFAGARIVDVETVIKFTGQGPVGAVRKVTIGDDWIDPIVGVRGTWPLNEKLQVRASGDIGGFGLGSDFAWQAVLSANYQYSERVSFLFSYRYLDMDYDDNGFVLDVVSSGPIMGVGFSF